MVAAAGGDERRHLTVRFRTSAVAARSWIGVLAAAHGTGIQVSCTSHRSFAVTASARSSVTV